MLACGGCWCPIAVDARRAAWWARAMAPGVRPVGGVLGVRPDGGWSTAAPRGGAGRVVWCFTARPNPGRAQCPVGHYTGLASGLVDPTSAALNVGQAITNQGHPRS